MEGRWAAVSVDLDEVPCYTAIHGLESPSDDAAHAVYRRCIDRLANTFESLDVPATFFAIGKDLQAAKNRATLRSLDEAGHEIANHSYAHDYDFSRKSEKAMAADISKCSELIEQACGKPPAGFRAPGYVINNRLIGVLANAGFEYDSSVFPCPSYFAAKSAALAWIMLRGRKSASIQDDPRVLLAPADPYRSGSPYWRKGEGLVELPIGVTRGWTGRAPFIGTSVALGGQRLAHWLTRAIVGRPFVNLELHGIDAADADGDGLTFLKPHQPDLRRSASYKLSAIATAIQTLKAAGYQFGTLKKIARTIA